jgi:hypothetical protein
MNKQVCRHTKNDKPCKNKVLLDGLCVKHIQQKCTVCLENVKSINSASTHRLPCGHAFHTQCLLKSFVYSDQCPVCRQLPTRDEFYRFKVTIEDNMRQKYYDAIKSLERENDILRTSIRVLRASSLVARGGQRVRFSGD